MSDYDYDWYDDDEEYGDMTYLEGSSKYTDCITSLKDKNRYWVSYAFEYTKGKDTFIHNMSQPGCYGDMEYLPFNEENQVKSIRVALRYDSKFKSGFMGDYWKFLLGPNSPYVSLLKKGSFLSSETAEQAPWFEFPLTNSTNSTFMVSLLMSMRQGKDNPGAIKLFYELVNRGWTEVEAFYAVIYFFLGEDNIVHPGISADYYSFTARLDNSLDKLKASKPTLRENENMTHGYGMVSRIFLEDPTKFDRYENNTDYSKVKVYSNLNLHEKYAGVLKKAYENSYDRIKVGTLKSVDELHEKKELILV